MCVFYIYILIQMQCLIFSLKNKKVNHKNNDDENGKCRFVILLIIQFC